MTLDDPILTLDHSVRLLLEETWKGVEQLRKDVEALTLVVDQLRKDNARIGQTLRLRLPIK